MKFDMQLHCWTVIKSDELMQWNLMKCDASIHDHQSCGKLSNWRDEYAMRTQRSTATRAISYPTHMWRRQSYTGTTHVTTFVTKESIEYWSIGSSIIQVEWLLPTIYSSYYMKLYCEQNMSLNKSRYGKLSQDDLKVIRIGIYREKWSHAENFRALTWWSRTYMLTRWPVYDEDNLSWWWR